MSNPHTPRQADPAVRHAIAQPGTNLWVMTERFREELKKDTNARTFDDHFADSVSHFMHNCKRKGWQRLLVVYALSFLLIVSLAQYELPLQLPYLSQSTTHGLVDITLVVLLLTVSSIIELISRPNLFEAVLRVYGEERYSKEQQDFILLKWGVDLLFDGLTLGQYGRPWRQALNVLNIMNGAMINCIMPLILMVTVLWGVGAVLYDPSYGIVSIFALVAALGIFVYTLSAAILCRTKPLHI